MARQSAEERLTRGLQRKLENMEQVHDLAGRVAERVFSGMQLRRPPKMPRKRSGVRRYEACLVLSDFQAGKVTESYDSDVFRRRLASLADPTLALCEQWGVETLHVFLLGDLVEGSVIYPGQAWRVDCPAFEQACELVPQAVHDLVHELLTGVRRITVTDVQGNHGRVGPKGAGIPERDNFDAVAARVLEVMLQREGLIGDRLEFQRSKSPSWFNYRKILGHGCLLVHGHQLSPTTHKLKSAMLGWAQAAEIPDFEFLFLGHFHNRTIVSANGLEARISPSLDSGCEFALEKLQATSEAAQMLYVFHRKHGIVGEHELKVDRL